MDTNADQYYKDCDESDADAHNACYAGADDYHADADEADIAIIISNQDANRITWNDDANPILV